MSLVNRGVEGVLEIFCDLTFVELLFNSVDNRHYSTDVLVKHVALL
jgi:hypothetical protein